MAYELFCLSKNELTNPLNEGSYFHTYWVRLHKIFVLLSII